jgi:hypothetical protein
LAYRPSSKLILFPPGISNSYTIDAIINSALAHSILQHAQKEVGK